MLQRFNAPESGLSGAWLISLATGSRSRPSWRRRERLAREEEHLAQLGNTDTRHPWLGKGRAAALGFGLGATLALSPFVWADDPPAANPRPPAASQAPETMTSPIALMQHQSFAPL